MRILSNDEKMLMFGLVDKEMRENITQLKKLVGIKSPAAPRRKTIGMSSIENDTTYTSAPNRHIIKQIKIITGQERTSSQGNAVNMVVSPGIRKSIVKR